MPVVLKFGGAAVATPERFDSIAEIVLARLQAHSKVVVVVSAMGGMTDQLIALAKRVNPEPPVREMDMLISVGERISVSLLAMALAKRGHEAVSFTGSQSGIITSCDHTDAKILNVKPSRLVDHLAAGQVVIVAGFQGVSTQFNVTTLGRGGSDTSAVALAVALGARCVEFYKDVPGICTADPKHDERATLIPKMTHSEAATVVLNSHKPVLHPRGLDLAARNGLPLRVLSFIGFQPDSGTWITSEIDRPASPIYEVSP